MIYIPQIQNDDCGFACLKMLLAEINHDKNYLFLSQDENHGRYSFKDLIDIAQYHGVTLGAFRMGNKETAKNKPKLPFIAVLTLKNGAKHAVVVQKIRLGRVVYLDPRCGKVNTSFHRFLIDWDGSGLLIISFQKRKTSLMSPEPIHPFQKSLLCIIQVLAGIFTFLGIYFVRDGVPIYWPIIFLSLAIIFEIIMKIVAYKLMKKMDRFFFEEKRIPNHDFKEYLNRFENFKKLSISLPMNFVVSIILSIGLITITLLNDYRHFVIVLTPLVLSLLEALFISPFLKRKKQDLAELEADIDNASSPTDFKNKASNAHKEAYRYSYLTIAYSVFSAAMILLSVILTMYCFESFSLTFIVFYSFLGVALLKSCDHMFSYNERKQEMNKAKVKISNLIKKCDEE